jgi:hypothetical protein
MLFFPIPTVNLPNNSEGQNATILSRGRRWPKAG